MRLIGFITLVLLVASCGSAPFFEEFVTIDGESWEQDDVVRIEVDIEEPGGIHDFYFNLRNTKGYPYSNIHIFLTITDPEDNVFSDTLEYRVAMDDGKWTGETTASYVVNSWLTYEGMQFKSKGTYVFEIKHGMYDQALPEISAVGIKLD